MKCLHAIIVIIMFSSCHRKPDGQMVIIDDQKTTVCVYNGDVVTSRAELRSLVRKNYTNGHLPVTILVDPSVPISTFQSIAEIFGEEGARDIFTGSHNANEQSDLYQVYFPHYSFQGVEWGQKTEGNTIVISMPKTQGAEIQITPSGFQYSNESVSIENLSLKLRALSGTNKNRVLIEVHPESSHDKLLRILKLCRENNLEAYYFANRVLNIFG
jgi:biopolymer transport protein ExbD